VGVAGGQGGAEEVGGEIGEVEVQVSIEGVGADELGHGGGVGEGAFGGIESVDGDALGVGVEDRAEGGGGGLDHFAEFRDGEMFGLHDAGAVIKTEQAAEEVGEKREVERGGGAGVFAQVVDVRGDQAQRGFGGAIEFLLAADQEGAVGCAKLRWSDENRAVEVGGARGVQGGGEVAGFARHAGGEVNDEAVAEGVGDHEVAWASSAARVCDFVGVRL